MTHSILINRLMMSCRYHEYKRNKCAHVFLLTLLLIIGVSKAFAGTETVVRNYDVSSLTITPAEGDGISYSKLEFGDLYTSQEVGAPELPVEYVRFIVPVASKGFTATVSMMGSTITHRLLSRIWPVQSPVRIDGRTIPVFVAPDENAYAKNHEARAEVVDDSFIDGCNHIVTVAVYPVAYSDADRTVKAASQIEVKLSFVECSVAELDTKPIFPPLPSPYFQIEDMVVNTVSVPAYAPRRSVTIDSVPERYYIITPKNLEEPLRHLATWKGQKGYQVTVKFIEDIYATSRYAIGQTCMFDNGTSEEIVDSAASLRAYLKDQYIAHGSYFCLLVGDYRTPMPIRRTRSKSLESAYKYEYDFNPCGEYYTPTDTYFSDFTTKWDLTKWSREKIYSTYEWNIVYAPDVVTGRLLCSQPKEIENYLRKLIIYESNPGLGDVLYLQNHLYFEQDSWKFVKDNEGNDVKVENGSLLGTSAGARNTFSPFPETTTLIADSCRFKPDGTPHIHKGKDIIKAIGASGYSNWYAHGSPTRIGTCHWFHFIIPITSYTDEQAYGKRSEYDYEIGLDMMDNRNKPSVAYSVSCDIAPFDMFVSGREITDNLGRLIDRVNGHIFDVPYNFGGAFTVAGDFGGPALLCNTRFGWFSSGFEIHRRFHQLLAKNPIIGIAETLSKSQCSESHARVTHHLIGEPEFKMWTVLPRKLDNLTVKVEDHGLTISGNDLLGANVSTYNGRVGNLWQKCSLNSIEISAAATMNDFTVSIWKTGYLPFIGLYSFEGTMTDQKKEYIVQTAMLGNPFYADSTDNNGFNPTVFGFGTSYTVYATEKITAYPNLIVDDGSEVMLDCEKDVEIACTVKSGGKLTVVAEKVKMNPGFKVEKGGIFKMKKK